jgi:NADPH:quinone reductase-like Zn-dependent oxidoreductase
LPIEALVRKPTNLSFEQAASIGVNFVIARLGAIEYGGVQQGETVAVIGVGGGVGGAVAQIAAAQVLLSSASTSRNRRRRTRSQRTQRVHPQQRRSP